MQSEKQAIRRVIRGRLAEMSNEDIAEASRRIAERVTGLAGWAEARVVMAYLALPGEVQTRAIIDRAWADGKTIVVPRVNWELRVMSAIQVNAWSDQFQAGRLGLVEPADNTPADAAAIDLALVPGLAFDASGGRLGRGGGFFDRFLAQPGLRAVVCGLAFDGQRVERLPREASDVGVDLLVFQSGLWAYTDRGRRAAGE